MTKYTNILLVKLHEHKMPISKCAQIHHKKSPQNYVFLGDIFYTTTGMQLYNNIGKKMDRLFGHLTIKNNLKSRIFSY